VWHIWASKWVGLPSDSISSTDHFGVRVSFIAQPKAVKGLHLAGAWSRHSKTTQLVNNLKKSC